MGANNGIVVVMVDVSWDSNQQEHTKSRVCLI